MPDRRKKLKEKAGKVTRAVAGTLSDAGKSATEKGAETAKEAGKTVRVKSAETGKAVKVKGAKTAKEAAAAAAGEVSDRVEKRKERVAERREVEREARERGRDKALKTYRKEAASHYQDRYEMRLGVGEPARDRRDRGRDGAPDDGGHPLGPTELERARQEAIEQAQEEALEDYQDELVDEYTEDYRVQLGLEEPEAPAAREDERVPPEADPRLGAGMGAPEMGAREAGAAPEMGGAEAGPAPEMGGVGVGMFHVPRGGDEAAERRPMVDPVGVGMFTIPPATEGQAALPAGQVDRENIIVEYPEVADPEAGLDIPDEYRL